MQFSGIATWIPSAYTRNDHSPHFCLAPGQVLFYEFNEDLTKKIAFALCISLIGAWSPGPNNLVERQSCCLFRGLHEARCYNHSDLAAQLSFLVFEV